jgi:hypothetical protein
VPICLFSKVFSKNSENHLINKKEEVKFKKVIAAPPLLEAFSKL